MANDSPKHNDADNTSQGDTTVCTPMNLNGKDGFASGSQDNEDRANKELRNEENATSFMKNGELPIEEEKNEETVMEEEKNQEENAMEEAEKNESNVLEEEDDEQHATGEEDKAREEEREKEENKEKEIEQQKRIEKEGSNSKEKGKRSRKRDRKKIAARKGSETVATKLEDKNGSSSYKRSSKRAESMGMIFMCSSKTKKDCYRYKVLGLPANKRDIVEKVYKGMRLFLFDVDLRLMYGIYKAAGPGGYNIEPEAFKSAFPSQVRFNVLEDCLPIAEEKFKAAIKDNYYTRNKFDCQLNSQQVKKLCKLFVAASRGSTSKKAKKDRRLEARKYVDRDRIRRRRLEERRRSASLGDRQHHDRPIMYERDVYTSAVAPLPRLPHLPPPPASITSYYGRTLEVDAYRRVPVVDHDHRLSYMDLRHRDEISSRDSYMSYREPVYSAALPPEYDPPGLRPEYRPPSGPQPELHYSAAAPSDYGPVRHVYRY